MQVTETNADGLKREFKVVVPATDIDALMNEKLKTLSQTITIKGFRPGKVPVSLVRKRFGSSVMNEVLQEKVNDSSQQAMTDRGLRPAMPPKIDVESFNEGSDLTFTMSLETLPEFEPADIAKMSLTRVRAEVGDDDVDTALERLAEQQKNYVDTKTKRKSKSGDLLVIDFVGKVDGEPFEGGASEDHQLELGSGTFIPGFEDQLTGAKAGEHVTVTVTFPEAYPSETLRGKEATFDVDVKAVKEREPVAVDDQLAARLGLSDLQALKSAVRGQIERDYAAAARMRLKRGILDELADSHDFAVPESMADREFDQIWKQIEDDMKQANKTWDDVDETEEETRTEYRGIAERRVRLGLILSEIGQRNNITVPQDEVNRAMMEQARRFPGQEQKVFDYFRNSPEAMNELQAPLYEDKVIDFIAEMATVTDKTVSAEELMRDPDESKNTEEEAKPKTKKRAAKKKETSDK